MNCILYSRHRHWSSGNNEIIWRYITITDGLFDYDVIFSRSADEPEEVESDDEDEEEDDDDDQDAMEADLDKVSSSFSFSFWKI